jgi:phytoene dehydrogenase-like protein
VNGKASIWGHAIGGMGAITQAITQAIEREAIAHGARINTDAPVRRVIVEGGRATGHGTR